VSLRIFYVVPPTEPCALRSTQPLKVSTRDFSWGKGGRCAWLKTYHPFSAETSRKSGTLIYPEPLGPPRPVAGHLHLIYVLNVGTVCIFVCACIYIHIYAYVMHIYTYIYSYIHSTYIHTYIHTHVHTYTLYCNVPH